MSTRRSFLFRSLLVVTVCAFPGGVLTAGESPPSDPFTLQGYDRAKVETIFRALKDAANRKVPQPIEPYIKYPLPARSDHQEVLLLSNRDLERNFDRVFNSKMMSVILAQNFDDLFVNAQGVMFGDGEIWISKVCKNAACSDAEYLISALHFE